ncbi:MAG: hypothetical protein Kow00124_06360 [Anaerolineae bacterium]
MTGKQEIEFIIRPDGTVEEKVSGVSGPDCEKITEAVEKALGEVTRRDKTPEYYNGQQGTADTVSTSS